MRARFAYYVEGIKTKTERNINRDTTRLTKTEASDAILTIPNIISFIRLLLIPALFYLLLQGHNIAATILFALAASTDWIDGLVARSTNSVSKLGRILDPAVDRLLMIFAVVGLMLVDRLPVWIMILVLLRNVIMLFGYYAMLKKYDVRVDVIFAGKLATALLYFGFFGLFLNTPFVPGLGITSFTWLPGFTLDPAPWGIWFVYAGIILGVFTTAYYAIIGLLACHKVAVTSTMKDRP